MAAKKKNHSVDLAPQPDPRASLDGALLLSKAQGLLSELEADLLARARGSAPVREALRARHDAERAARRTADPLEVWERHFVTQVAASWLLSCVFVRTLEDRGLLGHNRIAGPGALDSQRLFFELAPSLTEREYLLTIFRELSRLPAARDLFDARHNPVWMLGPSADTAKKLVALFRTPNADAPGLRFGQADTRFLGDLYQDLSADVRERFALLQTPHFVEKYILDRTLERAIARFGLDETTLIDPTCGSGHFLLGAFERLVDHRLRTEPGLDVREAARRAIDAVYGADINPYAVAIARFRLTLAFLDKAGYARLADAPALPLHLVVADSLLHNPQHAQAKLGELAGQTMKEWGGDQFALEDERAARDVLQNALVRDSLKWSEGRFDTIHLEDRNLPAIAEKRILRSKDDSAKKALDDAFRTMRAKLGDAAWQLLLGELDEKEFRRLYPFSPVLMDALVALSNSLQRERTAIRLLTELLVEHVEDLQVGDVVGVGDLFDVIAGGDDSTDGIMRARFDSAKQLYAYQFLPVIQQANGTNTPEKCQRLRPNHPARVGCSNCPERACRADNRLVKTMLVASLVPERPAFKDLTASKLVQLNHGSLRAPIPGTEVNLVAQKLRNWASSGTIAQLHVGAQNDPTVRLQLEGVDPGPILEQARQFDTPGARQKVLRDLLFVALGIEGVQDWGKDHVIKNWRGTDRLGHLRFGNVRRMTDDQLMCPPGHDWRLIVDYPFDDDGFGPHDDEKALEAFLQGHSAGTWTIVWLPTFFSKDMQRVLGDLVILEHILSDSATTRQYVSHLSVENQSRAITDLGNLRTQKQARLRQVLEQAYGLAKAREGDLDLSNAVEKHIHVLKPGAVVRPQLAATLGDAVERYAEELLAARYRLHPKFPKKLTRNTVEELVNRFGEIVDAEEKSVPVDRERAEQMRGFLMELGLVRVTEDKAFIREDDTLQRLENMRQKKALDRPEVGEVRSWIDDTGARGLQADALDLIVRCYARWSARTLVNGELPYEVKPGHEIPAYVVLEQPDLPTHAVWSAALNRAGDFGISLAGRALHGDNLKRFEAAVVGYFKPKQPPATRLPTILEQRMVQLGVSGATDRLTTAHSADALCAELIGKKGKAIVETLAGFEPTTSGRAVAASLAGGDDAVRALDDELVWGPIDQLRARDDIAGGAELLERLSQALRQDELHVKLGARIRELAKGALSLLQPKAVAPPPAGAESRSLSASGHGRAEAKAALSRLLKDAEAALETAGDDVEISGSLRLTWRKKP